MPTTPSAAAASGAPKLLDRVSAAMRARQMSRRTEKTYRHWIRRYILFHGKRHPIDLAEHPSSIQRAVKHAARNARIDKPATPHTMRNAST
jgi:hypothetical protein